MVAFIKKVTGLLDRLPASVAYWIVGLIGAILSAVVDLLPNLDLNPFVGAAIGSTIAQAIYYWTPVTEQFGVKSKNKVEAAVVITDVGPVQE